MKLVLIKEGGAYTVYALEFGDRYDFSAVISALDQSNPGEAARIVRRLDRLAESGPSHDKRQYRSLGDGLYEAKARGGTRAIFFYSKGKIVICTSAFQKRGQRTDPNQIQRAKRRREAFFRAQESDSLHVSWSSGHRKPRRKP